MKIAINALAVDGGGGQTYLENLLAELDRRDLKNRYAVLLRKNHTVNLPPLPDRFEIALFSIPRPYLIGRFFIEQFLLPGWLKKNKIDLLYSPADATTLASPCPVVLAMRNPNLYTRRGVSWSPLYKMKFWVLGTMAKLSARKARQIIFVSKASEKLVRQAVRIPPEKINVIHHGVSPIFIPSHPAAAPGIKRISPDLKPYILSVSSIYRYKNYTRLIEAFTKIRGKLNGNPHLVIIGSSFDNAYYQKMLRLIADLGLEKQVHCLGGFLLNDLPPVYRQATLFAFPSFLETFGHTLVEAMASGVPVAAGDIEPTREITGGAALYFDPFNVDSMARALLEGLSNKALRANLIEKGKVQAARFSWEKCVRQTLKVFDKASSSASMTFAGEVSPEEEDPNRARR